MSNVILNAGSGGATLGTDTVTGTPDVEYQIVKIGYSVSGSAPTQVSTTNPLPVSDAGGSLTVDNGGTFAVQAAQSGTWNVNNISGTVSLPTGAATAAKQPALGTAGSASADVLTVQGIASMTALKVDGSGVTQPVSAAALPLPTGAATAAKQPALGTAGAASSDVITIQGIASMTKLLVTPDSVALPANQSVNVNQLAGTTPDTNSGNKSAGTLRVVLATDQPALTNKLLVTPDANSAINCAQIAGTTTATGNGTASAGCQRVTIASDNTAFSVNATTVPSTSGGLSVATGSIAATKTDLKGSAGQVYGWYFYNPNASVAYVQFFNAAAANVTLGTTAPVYSLGIPAGSAANVEMSNGIAHSTAICIAVTTTRAGSTGPSSTVDYNVFYK